MRAEAAGDLFAPGRLGPLSLRNRFIKAAMDDGFAFVQLERALLADPDLVQQLERTRCTAYNECIAAMDDGGVCGVLGDRA